MSIDIRLDEFPKGSEIKARGGGECLPPTACDITFSTSVRAFPLLAYADSLKKNGGYSVRIRMGVASCMVSTCRFVRKMAFSSYLATVPKAFTHAIASMLKDSKHLRKCSVAQYTGKKGWRNWDGYGMCPQTDHRSVDRQTTSPAPSIESSYLPIHIGARYAHPNEHALD